MIEKIDMTPVDRDGWPAGPWDTEPEDRIEFEHSGFPCLMIRQPMGFWCGYVAVPPGHRWHGEFCDDIDVDVHGGLTYASECDGSRICHIPKAGEPDDVWWLGFDCFHGSDISPERRMLEMQGYPMIDRIGFYRTKNYVIQECRKLAEACKETAASKVANE